MNQQTCIQIPTLPPTCGMLKSPDLSKPSAVTSRERGQSSHSIRRLCAALGAAQEPSLHWLSLPCSPLSVGWTVSEGGREVLPRGISSQYSVLWLSTMMNQNSQALRTTALASCGCHDKLPQTWWLNKAAIYSSTVLEVRSLKSRGWQDWLRLWGLRQSIFSSLLASDGGWQPLAFLGLETHSHKASFLPSLIKMLILGFRVCPTN